MNLRATTLRLAPALALTLVSGSAARAQDAAPKKLAIGDAAPALAVETWVKGEPVAGFEAGKTYLIQFWAPWSKASADQMPVLSALQKAHADKGLVVLSMCSADLSGTTVEKVDAKVKELGDAVGVPVAWDKGSTTKDAFLKAAGRTALPCAVVVDREGRVAFLESAPRVESLLPGILDGTQTIEALTAWHAKAARAPATKRNLDAAAAARKWAEVVPLAEELLEVDPIEFGGQAQIRFLAQAQGLGAVDKAYEWARAFVDGRGWLGVEAMNAVAWAIVDPENPMEKKDLDLALKAAERSAELSKHDDGAVLDTLARVYFLRGDLQKALDAQKLAVVKLKPNMMQFMDQLKARLAEYEAAVAAQK